MTVLSTDTKTTILAQALKRLGQRQADAKLTTYLSDEFDANLRRLFYGIPVRLPPGNLESTFTPWFAQQTSTEIVLSANVRDYLIPNTYVKDVDNVDTTSGGMGIALATSPANISYIPKDDFHTLVLRYKDYTAQQPLAYATFGLYLSFFPTPDAAYQTYWDMVYRMDDASLAGPNTWTTFATDLLVSRMVYIGARYYTKDATVMQMAEEDFYKESLRLYYDTIARQDAGRMFQRGED